MYCEPPSIERTRAQSDLPIGTDTDISVGRSMNRVYIVSPDVILRLDSATTVIMSWEYV